MQLRGVSIASTEEWIILLKSIMTASRLQSFGRAINPSKAEFGQYLSIKLLFHVIKYSQVEANHNYSSGYFSRMDRILNRLSMSV